MACLLLPSCGCMKRNCAKKNLATPTVELFDSCMSKVLSDSICNIIANADCVTIAKLQIKGDTITESNQKELESHERALINFIVTNPAYFQSNHPVYGLFYPQISISYKHKSEKVTLRYDLSLKKWSAYNSSGNEMCRLDISDNSMLRASSIIFPNDTLLKTLLIHPAK